MDAFLIMLKNVLVFVLLAVPGLILVKTKQLKSEQSGVLSKVMLYIAVPFLVLDSVMDVSFDSELLRVMGISALISIVFLTALFFLSRPLTAMEKNAKTRGIMRFATTFTNNGFLGFPLVAAVFPDKPLVMTSVVVINLIMNVYMYTLGVFLITGDKSNMSVKKAVLNPVLIAFAVGLLFNLLNVPAHVPEVSTYAGYLGGIVTALSMLILGMKLGDVSLKSMFASWKTYYVAAIKLVVMPVIVVGIVLALHYAFALGEAIVLGTFVSFALPSATLGITFADNYGGDTTSGVTFTLGNTVLSVATISLLYALLQAVL